MPSTKQGKSSNSPPSPSKVSFDALSKLIEDKFASLEAHIVSVEDQINKHLFFFFFFLYDNDINKTFILNNKKTKKK